MSDRITEAENSTETGGFANAMLAAVILHYFDVLF